MVFSLFVLDFEFLVISGFLLLIFVCHTLQKKPDKQNAHGLWLFFVSFCFCFVRQINLHVPDFGLLIEI
jgi:hypothetical protein